MHPVKIQSRRGNVVLGIVGAIDAVSAAAILLLYLVSSWGAVSAIDYLLQLMLVASAFGGAYFVLIGAANLGRARRSPATRDFRARRAIAEAS